MLNDREKVMQLKRNFESYGYYVKSKHEIDLKIVEINTKLEGLQSPRVKEVFIENKSYHNNIIELTERRERFEKLSAKYQVKIQALEKLITLIPLKRDQYFIQDYYFNGLNRKVIAKKYSFHENSVSRQVNKILLEIVRNFLYKDLEI